MNEFNNKYYLKKSIIFSLLSCFVSIIFWLIPYVDDIDMTTIIYCGIFIIQSGIFLLCYGLGHCLDFNIRPLIIFFSFGDLVLILGLGWVVAGITPGDGLEIFRHFDALLYFVLLFLSKFWLINILKKVDERNDKR